MSLLTALPSSFAAKRVDWIASTPRRQVSPEHFNAEDVFLYSIPQVQESGTGALVRGDEVESNKWEIEAPCLLVSRLNPRKSTICRATPQAARTLASTEFVVLETGSDTDSKFLEYVLTTPGVTNALSALATSATRSHQRVSPKDITSLGIPWPDRAVRKEITSYLDHETAEIDAFIADLEKLKGLANERLTDLRLSTFRATEGSSTVALRRVVRIVSGSGFPVGSQGDASQEIPFFKVKDLSGAVDGHLQYPSDSVSRKQAKELGAKIVPPGSIVMAKLGAALYLNRNAIVQVPSCIDNNLMALVPDRTVEPAYLQQVLHTSDLRPLGNPGAVPSLNMDWFKELRIHLPDRDVQREVADQFDSQRRNHDKYLEEIDKALALARERRAALISTAVTGKLDDRQKHQSVAQRLEAEIGATR